MFNSKWLCFVCAEKFDSYMEMRTHIFDKHEEGREYVVCPLKRCGVPVRDIRSHFEAKHPKDKIPKKCQLKALVWNDFGPSGIKKTNKPIFKEGFFESKKNNKPIYYRSGYEKTVYECLEKNNNISKYEAEPFHIYYNFENKRRKYYPDLSVFYENGEVEIWEIKPKNQTDIPMNQAKWTAAAKYCKDRGWRFKVKTEKGIRELIQESDKN